MGRRQRRREQLLDSLNKLRNPGNRKRKHCNSLCEELALEEPMDQSCDYEENI
jgi:hypothetical protein